uniref:Nitric oxide-associated protein 1 n=2 Tax=Cacopsylla melanoneura TaxID=428564 RepID=A0A8D8Y9T3_9HEMI
MSHLVMLLWKNQMVQNCRALKYVFISQRNLPYICSLYHRKYVTARQPSISKPFYLKDQKKMMVKNFGDDLLEKNVRDVKHKIIFNSHIKFGLDIPKSYGSKKKFIDSKFSDGKMYNEITESRTVPISLKFLEKTHAPQQENIVENNHSETNNIVLTNRPVEGEDNRSKEDTSNSTVFPYQLSTATDFVSEDKLDPESLEEEGDFYDEQDGLNVKNWMQDYEVYDDSHDNNHGIDPSYFEYGTADPTIKASSVPCGGCGAHLHCQDLSIPGYLPREIFHPCSEPDLRGLICQRCHLMKNYNMALNVNVKPEDYPKILEPLKAKKALVILMVDMTDFPCSIWPGILDVIGVKRPIFVVGNKIDAIPSDRRGWLKHAEQALRDALPAKANVKDVTFISAKTGYGVEELITKIFKIWQLRGDVYLVGCTNVGKSTLFNAFLQSDMCKAKASDLVRRATTSPWPGTTLNLLKFPIMRPNPHQMHVRNLRLRKLAKLVKQENDLYEIQKRAYKWKDIQIKSLVGHIGRSFTPEKPAKDENDLSVEKINHNRLVSRDFLDEKSNLFALGKWCYDTPGTVQPDQVIHLLTTEELVLTLPKSVICPRVFNIRPGQTLFIAGLGRVDFVESTENLSLRFAVMASIELPITVCYTQHAEEIYNSLLGTQAFRVPCGSSERLKQWPALEGREISLMAREEPNSISADLVLSSAGWVGVNMTPGQMAKFHCWTPEGRGIYVRSTPLQKYIHLLRGNKPRDCIMYDMPELHEDDEEE